MLDSKFWARDFWLVEDTSTCYKTCLPSLYLIRMLDFLIKICQDDYDKKDDFLKLEVKKLLPWIENYKFFG